MSCYGCVCNHCLYNAELEPWYFTPGEVQDVEEICYVCDECKHYDGDFRKRSRWKPACSKHRLPRKYGEKCAAYQGGFCVKYQTDVVLKEGVKDGSTTD